MVLGDGHVDPYSLSHAFAIGARKYGAEFYMPAPVRGLDQKASGEWEVKTDHGTIHAKRIINAAGNFKLLCTGSICTAIHLLPIDLSQDTVDLVSTGQKSLVLTKASLSILKTCSWEKQL